MNYHIKKIVESSAQNRNVIKACVACWLVICCVFFVPKLKIDFDLANMSDKSSLQEHVESLSFIIQMKGDINWASLCELKKTINSIPVQNIKEVRSVFSISVPYEEEGKLLFQPLLKLDCSKESSSFQFNKLIKEDYFKEYYGQENRDFLFKVYGSLKHDDVNNLKKYIEKSESHSVFYNGRSIINYYLNNLIKKDWPVNIVLGVLFFILFYFFYGSVRLTLIYFVKILTVVSFIVPLFVIFEQSLNPLNLSIFLIIAIASVEDYIFIINDYIDRKNIVATFQKYIRPSYFTSLTTVIGFGSLCLSDINEIRMFGLFTAFGAIVEWILTLALLPSLLGDKIIILKKRKINSLVKSFPSFFKYFSIVIFFIGLWSISQLKSNESADDIFHKGHIYHQDQQYFSKTRKSTRSIYLKMNRKLKANEFSLIDNVVSVRSMTDDYFETLSLSDAAKEYLRLDIDKDLKNFYEIRIEDKSIEGINRTVSHLKSTCKDDCTFHGRLYSYAKYQGRVLFEMKKSFLMSLVLVGLVLYVLMIKYKVQKKLYLIYCSFWGVLATAFVFYLLNIPVNFTTSIFLSVFLGIAGDNVIHFIFNDTTFKLESINQIGLSSLYISIFTIVGSLAMVSSNFKFTAILGLIFTIGFCLNFIGDFYLLKLGLKNQAQ